MMQPASEPSLVDDPRVAVSDRRSILPISDHQEVDEISADNDENNERDNEDNRLFTTRDLSTVLVLFYINLLNYMDRFTIAGVIPKVQSYYYDVDNALAGLLQTVFICSYMILSPIFGYLGDRYNRKLLMGVGIFFWSAVTLAGSFIPEDYYWAFMLLRGMVGVGEASYSTIAPTIIADLYSKSMRSKMLAIFYIAIPFGSGLGYIAGSQVAELMGEWQWALRVTPGLGLIAVILIVVVVREPERGESEGGSHLGHTGFIADLRSLCFNKSFVCSSLGFTSVAFVTGALAWWAPKFMLLSINVQGYNETIDSVSWIFGIITCAAGLIGVCSGSQIANWYKKKNPRADPLVCAFGMLSCAPFLYLALALSRYNTPVTWVLIFFGETLLCLNWSIVADILLYTVIPTRRSTAEAFQILMSHLFGDAGSPYLVGAVSDAVSGPKPDTVTEFISLQNSLYMTAFVTVLGGAAFLFTALFIEKDKKRAEQIVRVEIKTRKESLLVEQVALEESHHHTENSESNDQYSYLNAPAPDTTYVTNPPPLSDISPVV
ncbi:protein spinster homolog 1-like [Tubulanus polymorphus]|uniref:protein spinster homolog 1-like n=1 Tax=Tubulanus polymorphus TaxID=672921 RepID=UPI003DA45143